MELKRSRVHSSRELVFKADRIFYNDVDVTPIAKRRGPRFISLMGRVGNKSFHNYFGLDDNNVWYRYTGVTSALDYVGDKSNLMQWYANQVVEQFGWSKQLPDENAEEYNLRLAVDMLPKLETFAALDLNARIEFIKKCRTAASTYGRKTANLGKKVHSTIESYIKWCIKEHQGRAADMVLAEGFEQTQHFVNWAVKHNAIFKASELEVYSNTYWFAGTLDLVVELDGEMYIGDIKTTNSIWGRSYFAQASAYRIALEEMHPNRYKFAGSILIRIGRDGLFNPEEDVHFSPYFEEDKKYFLSALEVYRQENNRFSDYQ